MRIVTFDPEVSRPAYSMWEDGKLQGYGKVLYRYEEKIIDPVFFEAMQRFAERSDVLVIEDQWLPRNQPERIHTVKNLILVRAHIEYEWHRARKIVIPVQPLAWTKVVKRNNERLKSYEIRKRSVIVAQDISKQAGIGFSRKVDHNIAAAICMGHWFWTINAKRGVIEACDDKETGELLFATDI